MPKADGVAVERGAGYQNSPLFRLFYHNSLKVWHSHVDKHILIKVEYKTQIVESFKMSKKDMKREQIVLQAQKLFARFGLAKTSMDDIAKASAMGKSSLYYYFKSKEDVFEAVIRFEMVQVEEVVVSGVAAAKGAKDQLKAFITLRMNYLKERAGSYQTLLDEYLHNYAFIQTLRDEYVQWEIATIEQILADGVAEAVFAIDNCRTVATVLFYSLKGLEDPFICPDGENSKGKRDTTTNEIMNDMITILFNGIEKR